MLCDGYIYNVKCHIILANSILVNNAATNVLRYSFRYLHCYRYLLVAQKKNTLLQHVLSRAHLSLVFTAVLSPSACAARFGRCATW